MYLAQKQGDYRLQEIAAFFGLAHYGSVSCAIFQITEIKIAERQRGLLRIL